MKQDSDVERVARRTAVLLGAAILANVLIEGGLGIIVGNPLSPPFSNPQARFKLVTAGIPRFAQIAGGLGFLTLGAWNLSNRQAQRNLGRAFVLVGLLALLPLLLLFEGYWNESMGLLPVGLVRLRIQFVRAILFFATLSGLFWTLGRVLLARSQRDAAPPATV